MNKTTNTIWYDQKNHGPHPIEKHDIQCLSAQHLMNEVWIKLTIFFLNTPSNHKKIASMNTQLQNIIHNNRQWDDKLVIEEYPCVPFASNKEKKNIINWRLQIIENVFKQLIFRKKKKKEINTWLTRILILL